MQDLIMIDLRMVFHYCVQKPALIPKVLSQNFTDKSCLFKVKNMQSGSSSDPSRIHELWRRRFTYLHHIMRKGKAKLCTYTKTHFSISSPSQCLSQAVFWVITPRLGCTPLSKNLLNFP